MSELKVDKITPRQGTTLTLGDAGDTINFGSGVLPNFENLTVTGDLTVDTNSLKVDSTNNFVGIGTASPSVALDVVGAITATGNLTVDTNTLFVDSTNNRVGIGTASPASDLQIGTLTPLITASTKSISLGATYSNSAGSNPKLKLYDDGTNYMGLGVSANRLDFTNSNSLYDFVFYGGGSEILRFEGTGNVGIGTSSPLQPLHISYSNTSAIPTDALAEDTTGALQIYNTSDSANYAGIYLRARTSSSTNSLIGLRYNSSFNDGDMFFSIRDGSGSSNEVLTLKSSGNVGIGTSSPSSFAGYTTLSVNNATNGGLLELQNSGTTYGQVFTDGTNFNIRSSASANALIFDTNGANERMRIDSSGRVGIDETDNSTYVLGKKLVVGDLDNNDGLTLKAIDSTDTNYLAFADTDNGAGSYAGFAGYSHNDNSFRIGTSSLEAMRIDSSGNVLVGKTSTTFATAGVNLQPNGRVDVTRDGGQTVYFNRTTSDGNIVGFYKDGTQVGSIGTTNGNLTFDGGSGKTGLRVANDGIIPRDNGSDVDNGVDLGASSLKFKDGYFGGTVTANAFSGDGSALTNVPAGVSLVDTRVFSSSTTYTPTSGTKFVTVYCTGGGGGGGGLDVNNQDQYEGSGGNGGNTAVKTFNATELGSTASITIGSGGAGGSSSGNNGSTGGNTSFNPAGTGTTVTAAGGYGGYGISNDGGAAFNNTYNTGNSGTDYVIFGEICHRGGSLRQGSTRYIMGAIGGRSYFGRGGQGVSVPTNTGGASANGNDGINGGGGSAGVNFQQNGVNKSGGNGGNGIVVIEEYA